MPLRDTTGLSATAPNHQQPLWRLLCFVAEVLEASLRGVSWAQSQGSIPAECRPGVQALAFTAWRNLGRAQALRTHLVEKKPPPMVDALLCAALALIWREGQAPYPAHTLVSQATEAAKAMAQTQVAAGFVNGVLRRFLREQAACVADTDRSEVAAHNHSNWWLKRLKADHPEHWQAIAAANNLPAPLVLRFLEGFEPGVSDSITSVAIKKEVAAGGSRWQRVGQQAYALHPPRAVEGIAGFAEGHFLVQDAAAQLAVPLMLASLDCSQALRVLDACAAPGGKTAQVLSMAPKAQVVALDVSEARMPRMQANLQRLSPGDSHRTLVQVGDACEPAGWWDGELFDAILIDAPCSASGIVRRQPDVRWIRRESDVEALTQTQRNMLDALWPLLKPGGVLVYCTCSVFKVEGHHQAQAFQSRHSNALRLTAPGQLLPRHAQPGDAFTHNLPCDHDGFYFARFQKQA